MDIKGTGDFSLAKEVNFSIINLPGIKFDFNKLIDPTSKGLNKVFDLIWGEQYANKMRHILLTEAQTKADIELINSGIATYDPKEKTVTKNIEGIKSLLVSAIQDEEIVNLLQCAVRAAEYLDEESNNAEISQDFINRWRNEAKLISSDELQSIFGGILASEISNPGTISMRTLDVVKNLSKNEADQFLIADDYILWGNFLSKKTAADIKTLNECGLLHAPLQSSGFSSGTNWEVGDFTINGSTNKYPFIRTSQDVFVVDLRNVKISLRTTGWKLSGAGIELYQVIDKKKYSKQKYHDTILLIKESLAEAQESQKEMSNVKIYHSMKSDPLDFSEINIE